MFLQKIFTLAFFTLIIGQAFAQSEETRNISSFSKLHVTDAFKVYVTQGSSEKLTVKANEDYMQRIKTEVKDGTLHIYEEDDKKGKNKVNNNSPEIYLTIKNIESIYIAGASKIKSKEKLNFENLNIRVSGASSIKLEMNANKLDCKNDGASSVTLLGQVAKMELNCSGASRFLGESLVAQKVEVTATGASKVSVNATTNLRADASGAASISYKGQPSNINKNSSGAGAIRKM